MTIPMEQGHIVSLLRRIKVIPEKFHTSVCTLDQQIYRDICTVLREEYPSD